LTAKLQLFPAVYTAGFTQFVACFVTNLEKPVFDAPKIHPVVFGRMYFFTQLYFLRNEQLCE
jgi:hypothetical protein